MDKYAILNQYFGHSTFRPGQEALIDAILGGQDTLGIMPTGGGKSICYQVPALLLPGITLVVSPLISLMKDQVLSLTSAGIDSAYINSSLSSEQQRAVYHGIRIGRYKIVYIAPERLCLEGFLHLAQTLPISLLAVDEAHCISQWGQDFRPSYLKIPDFIQALPQRPPVAAFTATATRQVRKDIEKYLNLRAPYSVVTGFDRPNLFFEVQRPRDRRAQLLELIRSRPSRSGIVYCATRKNVEELCTMLRQHDIPATRYHAGLSKEERAANQEDFLFDRSLVMVATNAFGMGIDKSNVSYVIHYNMPKSVEAYYQEAGRAGRDGSHAECILLFAPSDIQTAKYLISHAGDDNDALTEDERREVIRRDTVRLSAMIEYCKTTSCLRGEILSYFGQAHEAHCEACGNCMIQFIETDITREAQMILSCIKRMRDKLGYTVGASLIAQVLWGSTGKRVRELELDTLSTYGLLHHLSTERIRALIERLEKLGYLETEEQHNTIRLTTLAKEVLFHGERVTFLERRPPEKAHKDKETGENSLLFEALRKLRNQIAQEEGVPAFVIFSNATLEDMARKAPRSSMEFRRVSGVGEVKANRYGKRFVDAIRVFNEE
ncbi:MAG: DNA helicase RecQ [Clostridiales bacterium]|nr:DNA helicase RecQ [Candidatus Cacconaster stercorequi]